MRRPLCRGTSHECELFRTVGWGESKLRKNRTSNETAKHNGYKWVVRLKSTQELSLTEFYCNWRFIWNFNILQEVNEICPYYIQQYTTSNVHMQDQDGATCFRCIFAYSLNMTKHKAVVCFWSAVLRHRHENIIFLRRRLKQPRREYMRDDCRQLRTVNLTYATLTSAGLCESVFFTRDQWRRRHRVMRICHHCVDCHSSSSHTAVDLYTCRRCMVYTCQ